MSDLDLKELWYSEPEKAPPTMNVAEVQSKASAFETKIKRRNILEWLACVVVVGLHAHDAFDAANALILIGNLIVIFAGLFIAAVLWRKGRVSLDADPTLNSVGFMHAHADALDAQAKYGTGPTLVSFANCHRAWLLICWTLSIGRAAVHGLAPHCYVRSAGICRHRLDESASRSENA